MCDNVLGWFAQHRQAKATRGGRFGPAHHDAAAAQTGVPFLDHGPDSVAYAGTHSRLGGRDLLIDLDPPLPGPFGRAVRRIRVPHWMAGGGTILERDGGMLRLGGRVLRYDQWGLQPT